jgi:hypothetical protein
VEKKKKKDFSFPGLGTRLLAHPGRERAHGSAYGPAATHERGGTARCVRVTASLRAHLPAGAGEKTALRPDGVANRPSEGEGPVAGGPVLGPRRGGLAWAEAGDSKGRLNSARGGWEGAAHGEGQSSAAGITAGGLCVGVGGWEVVLRVRGLVRELLGSLNFSLDQRRGRGRREKDSPERGTTMALRELLSGEGRRGVAEASVGKKQLGATLL